MTRPPEIIFGRPVRFQHGENHYVFVPGRFADAPEIEPGWMAETTAPGVTTVRRDGRPALAEFLAKKAGTRGRGR